MMRINVALFMVVLAFLPGCDKSKEDGATNSSKTPLEEEVTKEGILSVHTQVKRSADGKTTIKHGNCVMLYPNGKKAADGQYVEGKETGIWRSYTEDGTVRWEGKYVFGVEDGKWSWWDEKGTLVKTEWYQNGRKIESTPSSLAHSAITQPSAVVDDSRDKE